MFTALTAALVVVSSPVAAAQPPPWPGDPASTRLAELDAEAVAVTAELAAAQATLDARRGELAAATGGESAAAGSATVAAAGAEALRQEADKLVGAAYAGARTSRVSAVLVSTGPQDLLDRMTALDLLGEDSATRLAAAGQARTAADRALLAATAARERAAAAAQEAFDAQETVVARRATLVAQSAEAQALLATIPAVPTPDAQEQPAVDRGGVAARASRAGAARGVLVAQPTVGQLTSPFGDRGGTLHAGIDIANSIGTPIVAVADGVVTDAGPASGFGLWVRIRHDDGTITVYGHIDSYSVSAGQRVVAGEQVARMGNRGQSTGPHLHLEVITPGGTKVDPQAWLAERGVSV
ncbi:peptidoglycan DD-metalloendopeptidase family protein [Rhodococcus aerolatus]